MYAVEMRILGLPSRARSAWKAVNKASGATKAQARRKRVPVLVWNRSQIS